MSMRKLLRLMDTRSMTLSELASRLSLTESELKSRMELLVQMGNLEAVYVEDAPSEEGEGCPGCVLASVCKDEDTCSEGRPVVGYRLTDKGRRLARGTLDIEGDEAVDG